MNLDFYSHNLTVNFSDVNENNQTTNRGFLRLMQEVAGIHSGLLGYGVNDIPKTEVAWIILNWKLKVFSRPKTNTNITINTWAKYKNSLFSYRDFEVYDNNNTLIAIASSKWILFNVNKKVISKIPTKLLDTCTNDSDKSVFKGIFNEKLKEPDNSKFVLDYTVQRRDIDTNHHVNNLYYLDYAYEAIPFEVFENCNFSNVEIMYKLEIKLGDTISLFYAQPKEDEHVVTIKGKTDGKLHAIIKLY